MSEFSRSKKIEISPGIKIYIASPEDLIIKKLDFHRKGESEKHLTDIREVLMSIDIDNSYIELWVGQLGLKKKWEKAST